MNKTCVAVGAVLAAERAVELLFCCVFLNNRVVLSRKEVQTEIWLEHAQGAFSRGLFELVDVIFEPLISVALELVFVFSNFFGDFWMSLGMKYMDYCQEVDILQREISNFIKLQNEGPQLHFLFLVNFVDDTKSLSLIILNLANLP